MTKYTMRPLQWTDSFKMSKILKKLDIKTSDIASKIDVKKITAKTAKSKVTEQAGLQLVAELSQKILENLHLAEQEVNEFMGGLIGLSADEFSKLPLEEAAAVFVMFKDQKGIVGFFKQLFI